MIPSQKLADMSTCHITKDDSYLLDRWAIMTADPVKSAPLHVYAKSEYGWYVIVPPQQDEFAEKVQDLRNAGLSEAFISLLRSLSNLDFSLLCLDRDGEVLPDFQTFEW